MTIQRNIGLDYLRALAISIVLFNHALIGFYFEPSILKFEGLIAAISASTVLSIEWLFILSGFLIGNMMIRSFEKNQNWFSAARDFWLRRWFRTIPNYYLFLAINFGLVSAGIASGSFEFKYLVFSQNLAWTEKTPHFFGESWSLALDEWFYLIMPLAIGLLGFLFSNQKHKFILAALMLIAIPTLARIFHTTTTDFFQWDAEIRRITIYHLDATGWGVLAACVNKWFLPSWQKSRHTKALIGLALMAAGVFLVIGLAFENALNGFGYFFSHSFSITLMSAGTFLVLPWLTSLNIKPGFLSPLVHNISLYSYSIYLVHFPMIFIFRWMLPIHQDASMAYMGLITFAWLIAVYKSSEFIFKIFELPISDLRERFTSRVDAAPFK